MMSRPPTSPVAPAPVGRIAPLRRPNPGPRAHTLSRHHTTAQARPATPRLALRKPVPTPIAPTRSATLRIAADAVGGLCVLIEKCYTSARRDDHDETFAFVVSGDAFDCAGASRDCRPRDDFQLGAVLLARPRRRTRQRWRGKPATPRRAQTSNRLARLTSAPAAGSAARESSRRRWGSGLLGRGDDERARHPLPCGFWEGEKDVL